MVATTANATGLPAGMPTPRFWYTLRALSLQPYICPSNRIFPKLVLLLYLLKGKYNTTFPLIITHITER